MASNGLVANPKKTALIFLNVKQITDPIKIRVGDVTIKQEKSVIFSNVTFYYLFVYYLYA